MSIDIDWTALTGGPDGQDLAESIRAFIHDRFQTIELPRMIRSVNVHTFNFGTIPPEIEIQDVLDPLPLFYQDSDDDDDEDDDDSHDEQRTTHFDHRLNDQHERSFDRRYLHHMPPPTTHRTRSSRRSASLSGPPGSLRLDTRALESHTHTHSDRSHPRSAFPALPVPTPGLGVNTMTSMSGMGYFHLPLSAGLSGTSTPLAAVAGGLAARAMSPVRADRSDDDAMPFSQHHPSSTDLGAAAFSTETGTETATPHPGPEHDDTSTTSSSLPHTTPQHPLDTQITARVRYKGDISLSLAAEILLDYPTPAFANIPMKLRVTGVEFNGDALVVYTHARKATHFCFLAANSSSDLRSDGGSAGAGAGNEEMLKNISIESEIGQVGSNGNSGNSNTSSGVGGGNGNQVLKNVDKIEKLILDQVRRIFRDEFVYPNYWTFLI